MTPAVSEKLQQNLQEQLAEIDPVTLQYLDQLLAENPSIVQNIVDEVLDEPPKRPPHPKRAKKKQEASAAQNFPTTINEINVEGKFEGVETKGRHFIRWRFTKDLENILTPKFMNEIQKNVRTKFYMRHVYSIQLQNIEDNTVIVYYQNHGSPWIKKFAEAEKWLNEQENRRLESDDIKRPSTKWRVICF